MASVANEPVKATAEKTVVYKGASPYGTEFLSSHTLTPADLKRLGDDGATKPAVFDKENHFALPASDLHPAVLEALAKDPAFKVKEV